MKRYEDKSKKSGVLGYEIGDDFIEVVFKKKDEAYVYTYKSANKKNIEEAKKLAEEGKGLSTFISKTIHNKYASCRALDKVEKKLLGI